MRLRALVLSLSLFAVPALAAETTSSLVVEVGESKQLHRASLQRVAVKDEQVADVDVKFGGTVVVTGVAPGKTEVRIWKASGGETVKVEVRAKKP
jgi:Flp pilus assembly secretin CpaC